MATAAAIEAFIRRWQACEGGAERANYALFLTELCAIIGVAPPDPAHATSTRNDYVFERAVVLPGEEEDRRGRIDLYKRGCFVLEAKQSREGPAPNCRPSCPACCPTNRARHPVRGNGTC
ncbi:hypothetical protein P0F65_00885 [Sphingomonas sp. I4]